MRWVRRLRGACTSGLREVCALTLAIGAASLAHAQTDSGNCARGQTLIRVRTAAHELFLCEHGREVARFAVALGAGGVDKRKQGDRKTPRGTYALGAPRSSDAFGRFILVGYPTPEQRKQGYTGYAIGIHGPPRNVARRQRELMRAIPPERWRGMATSTDWTDGCIAVDTDADIETIAAWVRRAQATRVVIE